MVIGAAKPEYDGGAVAATIGAAKTGEGGGKVVSESRESLSRG